MERKKISEYCAERWLELLGSLELFLIIGYVKYREESKGVFIFLFFEKWKLRS